MDSLLASPCAETEQERDCTRPSWHLWSSDTESSIPVSAAESPAIASAVSSFSPPAPKFTEQDSDDKLIPAEEERSSLSSSPEEEMLSQQAYAIHANPSHSDANPDQQIRGANPDYPYGEVYHDDYENPNHSDYANCNQQVVDSCGSDVDVEKGYSSVHVKQGDGEEEGQGGCCRVCHLAVERNSMSGEAIKLGCACKDDLALAHRHCAEAWFKIKGNRTCEICCSTAQNIVGSEDTNFMDHWNDLEASNLASNRAERCWQNQPLCNSLLVCLILVLILSWLFRVTLF